MNNGLINYTGTKAKCRHLKILTCKGTLRQVFSRVYRLEIQSLMLVFSTQFCELLPLYNLLSGSTLPPPSPLPTFPVWISILYTRMQCVRGGGGYGFWASDRKTPAAKSIYRSFLRWRHFALSPMSLILLRPETRTLKTREPENPEGFFLILK